MRVILVDTSIWVDHLRSGNPTLPRLLGADAVLVHPWIIGEVALGNLRQRAEVIGLLRDLPHAAVAEEDEVLRLIDGERLYGQGIGYVDAHLIAATRLSSFARLWTRDKRLAVVTGRLGIDFDPAGLG